MHRSEAIAAGYRRCACPDVQLVISSYELTKTRPWSCDPMRNFAIIAVKGIRYSKPQQCWKAVCNQCGKAWLFGESATELRRYINVAGMEVAE